MPQAPSEVKSSCFIYSSTFSSEECMKLARDTLIVQQNQNKQFPRVATWGTTHTHISEDNILLHCT